MHWSHLVSSMLMLAIVVAGLYGWGMLALRVWQGKPVLTYQPRTPVPWREWHMGLIVAFVIACSLGAATVGILVFDLPRVTRLQDMSLSQAALLMLLDAGGRFVAILITLVALVVLGGATAKNLGFDRSQIVADLKLGITGFVLLAPPVYGLQTLLVSLTTPSQHPIIQLLLDTPHSPFFVASFVAAVLIAPVVEEYFFRVLLQGWLETLWTAWKANREPAYSPTMAESWRSDEHSLPADLRAGDAGEAQESLTRSEFDSPNPYASPTLTGPEEQFPVTKEGELSEAIHPESNIPQVAPVRGSWWMILITSTLFALAHFSHGPDPIPLFFLALGLGYLYQRTHRVLPCIVIHVLLNGFSMFQLWTMVWHPIQ